MEYLKVWTSFRELMEPLTDAEKGRLFVAMLEYAELGIEPQLSGNERYVWPIARQGIKKASDENERMRAMGSKGGRPRKTEENCGQDDKPTETYENLHKPTQTYANPYKEKDKVKDIYDNDTAHAREESSVGSVTVDPLIIKIQQELNGLTDTHYAALNDYRDALSDDVVSYAIDLAVGNGVRNWSYVEVILRGWLKAGVKTLGEAKTENEKHKQQPRQQTKLLRSQQYEQRDWKESEMAEKLGVDDLFKVGAV